MGFYYCCERPMEVIARRKVQCPICKKTREILPQDFGTYGHLTREKSPEIIAEFAAGEILNLKRFNEYYMLSGSPVIFTFFPRIWEDKITIRVKKKMSKKILSLEAPQLPGVRFKQSEIDLI